MANCSEPHASVGDITLRQLGIQAGSTTTVYAEVCARGSGEGSGSSGSGSSGSAGSGSDSNKRKSNGNGGHQRRVERKVLDDSSDSDGLLNDSSDSGGWQQPLVRLRQRGNKRKCISGGSASDRDSDSDSDDTRLVCSRGIIAAAAVGERACANGGWRKRAVGKSCRPQDE